MTAGRFGMVGEAFWRASMREIEAVIAGQIDTGPPPRPPMGDEEIAAHMREGVSHAG